MYNLNSFKKTKLTLFENDLSWNKKETSHSINIGLVRLFTSTSELLDDMVRDTTSPVCLCYNFMKTIDINKVIQVYNTFIRYNTIRR